jgi:hypothetical protein
MVDELHTYIVNRMIKLLAIALSEMERAIRRGRWWG